MVKMRATSTAVLYCHASHGIHRSSGRRRNRPVKRAVNDQSRARPTTPMNARYPTDRLREPREVVVGHDTRRAIRTGRERRLADVAPEGALEGAHRRSLTS